MKIFFTSAVREIDAYTIKHEPIASIDLMERAAAALFHWVKDHISLDRKIVVFAGTGNNGGDALALARMMAQEGYQVSVYHILISARLSEDCAINLSRLREQGRVPVYDIRENGPFPEITREHLVIDGLFGSGLNRPLQGLAAAAVSHINASGAFIVSIDIPSGLFGEDNQGNDLKAVIHAGITLTLQFPKLSFFLPENNTFTGDWEVIPIGLHPEAIASGATSYFYSEAKEVALLLKKRGKFSHKGTYGHALLIAGCYGRLGAAILASRSCLRAGVGLLTTHVPRFGNDILQIAVPEAMLSLDQSDILFSQPPDLTGFTAVGVGPALGCRHNSKQAILGLLEGVKVPLVMDADAINILAEHQEWIEKLPPETILTPHPKEFDRLLGPSESGWERLHKAIAFTKKHNVIVVLKGAFTAVIAPDGRCHFNSTGNPGMATAGSGDVLTGIILSLLAQHYQPLEAAILGVFLHGLAGDLAVAEDGQETMIASDITDNLGAAYLSLHQKDEEEKHV